MVELKFRALFEILEEKGRLEQPYAKKLSGEEGLFELRVRHRGQWRALYAYMKKSVIVVLSAFSKKTQKTPSKELAKAKKRLISLREEI